MPNPKIETGGGDSTGAYLDEIGQHSLLTAQHEMQLAKTIASGREVIERHRLLAQEGMGPVQPSLAEIVILNNAYEAKDTFIQSNL